MAAECRGSAALDRTYHLELAEAHMTGIGNTPGGAMVAEDIRDLQPWTGHRCGSGVLTFARFLGVGAKRSSGLSTLAIILVATRV